MEEEAMLDEVQYGARVRPILHLVAPLVTAGALWATRQTINKVYARVYGHRPPNPADPATSWAEAIAWTALITTTAALIEVSVRRVADEREVVRVMHKRGQALNSSLRRRADEVRHPGRAAATP